MHNHHNVLFVILSSLFLFSCASTPMKSHLADPFIWLEDIQGEKSMAWVVGENTRSEKVLKTSAVYQDMQNEATEILTSTARIPTGQIHAGYVYNFWQDQDHVRGILRRATLTSYRSTPEWETVLDIDLLAEKENANWVYDGYVCLRPDYDLCMIGLSPGGTDASEYREFSFSKKAFVDNGFYIPAAKSSVAWVDADTLLVGTDWGDGLTDSGYALSSRLLNRGEALKDAKLVYEGLKEDVGLFVFSFRDNDTNYPVTLRKIEFFLDEYHLIDEAGKSERLPLPGKVDLHGALNGNLFISIKQDWTYRGIEYAQGALLTWELSSGDVEQVFMPNASQAINEISLGESSVFVGLLNDVEGQLLQLSETGNGWKQSRVELPANGVVNIISGNSGSNELLVTFESLTVPKRLYFVDDLARANVIAALPDFYDASDVRVEQRFAVSSDGTRIPYFVMAKQSVLQQGNAPTIQYGYGGFEVPILPIYFSNEGRPQHGALAGKLWVSRGGVLVIANIRGGAEYGPSWHDSVLKENRQLAFDDFFAVSEALIESGVTSPEKLGAIGRSNGGLLMGVALTQRPDLYSAIDMGVPLSDMLRYHKLLAGASWVAEYGNPDIPAEREVLEKYSPYQNLEAGVNYPNVLFYTSTKDDRVHPGHARKMAARMQQLDQPFLYYENIEGGHGGAANQNQLAYRNALEYIYFYQQLMAQ